MNWYEEVPAVCMNASCENYRLFELVDTEDVLDDEDGGYIICPSCGQRIIID